MECSVDEDFSLYLAVFLHEGDTFKNVCSDYWGDLNYIDYSIRDINGDRNKDFVAHWHPSAGCCRADVYDVFYGACPPHSGKCTPRCQGQSRSICIYKALLRPAARIQHP